MTNNNGGFEVLDARTGKAVQLSMEGLWLTGRVVPVGARLMVVHTFRSAEKRPLEVVYAFGLPRDAALRRFHITGEGFKVRSELKPFETAQKEYEAGISQGHLSALARTYRDGRVNLSVGNIRPGETVKVFLEMMAGVDLRDDGLRFRFPFTLAPCYHSQARAIAVTPDAGEIELPEELFGDVLLPSFLSDPRMLHGVSFDLSIAMGAPVKSVASPSHAVTVQGLGQQSARVSLSLAKEVPDRDLVLDVQTAEAKPRVYGGLGKDGKSRFTAVVPSSAFGNVSQEAKAVVFVLDRSGSMSGPPIEQARRAIAACLATLSEKDRFGLVAFDDEIEVFQSELEYGSIWGRETALKFLNSIEARGGTELAGGIRAAIKVAGQTAGDLFVVTDGRVSGTEDIIEEFQRAGARVHCLGIGAASQDRFLNLLSRKTNGTCRFLTPRERVDMGALELFAGVGRPMATNLGATFAGGPETHSIVAPPPVVFEGHPVVVMAEGEGAGQRALELAWGEGETRSRLEIQLNLEEGNDAETVRLLQGARLITDLEAGLAQELRPGQRDKLAQREQQRAVAKLEQVSRLYGLASRAMSLVAVVERAGDDLTQVPTTKIVPVGMPQDVEFGAYFGGGFQPQSARFMRCRAAVHASPPGFRMGTMAHDAAAPLRTIVPRAQEVGIHRFFESRSDQEDQTAHFSLREIDRQDLLVGQAGKLMPDGGLPGRDPEERVLKNLALLIGFLAAGNTDRSGPFRKHVQKLIRFLESGLPGVGDPVLRRLGELVLRKAKAGEGIPEDCGEPALALIESASIREPKSWAELQRLLGVPA